MTDIAVSAMSPLPAVNATFTYGITGSGTEGKVPINMPDGLAILDGSGGFNPIADASNYLGFSASRWWGLVLSQDGNIFFDDGTGNGDFIIYSHGVGPGWIDSTTTFTLHFDVQSQTTDHTVTWPDHDGTVALQNFVESYAPSTGDTVTALALGTTTNVFIAPAGTLTALTLALPALGLFPNQQVWVTFTHITTTLTVTPALGTNGLAAPTATTAGQTVAFAWDDVNAVWQRFL